MLILLVEDDPLIAMSLEATLTDAGYEILGPASTASRGLELAQHTVPELALVNINLRDGSNGIELARELLSRWGVASLFVSGQAMEARRNQDAALGYIGKPYSSETVLGSVAAAEALLHGQAPPRIPQGLELFKKED